MSQTGSVRVLGGEPNPEGEILGPLVAEGMGGGAGTEGGFCFAAEEGAGGGRFDGMKGMMRREWRRGEDWGVWRGGRS